MSDVHYRKPIDFVLEVTAGILLALFVWLAIITYNLVTTPLPDYEYESQFLERAGVTQECYPNVMKEC